jgi:hypothetical protein
MAVTNETYAENPNARWQRKLRSHFGDLIKAGRAGRSGSQFCQELVGCDGVLLVAAIELAARATGLLVPGVNFWQRRGKQRGSLQIEHGLKVRTCLEGDLERAQMVFHWRNISINTISVNAAWDRKESPLALLPPDKEILAWYGARQQ